MAQVHAFKRTKQTTHSFGGITYVFSPNEKRDVVAEVTEKEAYDRFISIPEAFKPYGAQPVPEMAPILLEPVSQVTPAGASESAEVSQVSQVTPNANESKYVLVDAEAGASIDLRPMTDAQLHEFAKTNDIKVHPKAKGDTIRDKIVDSLKSEG